MLLVFFSTAFVLIVNQISFADDNNGVGYTEGKVENIETYIPEKYYSSCDIPNNDN